MMASPDLLVVLAAASADSSRRLEVMGVVTRTAVHELNNQMVAIIGFAELVLDVLPPKDPLREGLEEIRTAGLRVVAETHQLAAIARKLVPPQQPSEINGVAV